MLLHSLRLFESETQSSVRIVHFHEGVNFVVDATDSSRHNKVGKTTFLGLIDIALGAKSRKNLYVDPDTGVTNQDLKDIIHNRKLAVELIVDNGSDSHSLVVELFHRGTYKIDNEPVSQGEYWIRLNELFFVNSLNVPTFRQLIGSFVRVSVGKDTSGFLKYVNGPTSNSIYRAIYGFLFDIGDPADAKELADLQKEKDRIEHAEKRYTDLTGSDDPEVISQFVEELRRNKKIIESELSDILDPEVFLANREVISNVRSQYAELATVQSNLEYELSRIRAAIGDTERESFEHPDEALAQQLFDEVQALIPHLNTTFAQMVEFNEKLTSNKLEYLRETMESLESRLEEANVGQIELLENNGQYLALVQAGTIEQYNELLERVQSINEKIGAQEQIRATLLEFQEKRNRLEAQISAMSGELEVMKVKARSIMAEFNQYFTELARLINGESPVLVYSTSSKAFPVEIRDMEETSTGTRKSLIAAYDLAYQLFARKIKKTVPQFVVHDVVETIEGADLKRIAQIATDSRVQYVVAVLQEKLDSSQLDPDFLHSATIITLSTHDRVFEPASNMDY